MKDECSCPFCDDKSKASCSNSPCRAPRLSDIDKNVKVCDKCGAHYSAEYKKCPSCESEEKDKKRA
jgi:hypothetical protein